MPRQGGRGSTVDPFLVIQAAVQVWIQEQTPHGISLANEDQKMPKARAHMTVGQIPLGFHHELPRHNLQEQRLLWKL